MRSIVVLLLCGLALVAGDSDLPKSHESAMQSEVTRLKDLVNMLYAQIQAMQSEQKANEAKAAEKVAIEKRSKELNCEIEVTTGTCKVK